MSMTTQAVREVHASAIPLWKTLSQRRMKEKERSVALYLCVWRAFRLTDRN